MDTKGISHPRRLPSRDNPNCNAIGGGLNGPGVPWPTREQERREPRLNRPSYEETPAGEPGFP